MPFHLTQESWIPSTTPSGGRVELGLRETFARAHELTAIHDPSPLVTLTLHRLLLAILHRVFGPRDLSAYVAMFERGRFDMEPLDRYFEEHRSRFDLLDAERPFYQTRGLPYEPDGLHRLVLERSNYGAPASVFQHRPEGLGETEVLPLAVAARSLLVLHAFAPGGLVKKPGEPGSATAAPLNRGAYVVLEGGTVFETLMLNLLEYSPDSGRPIPGESSKDIPSWEQPALPRPLGDKEPKRKPYGWIDLLTWQSRRLELALASDGAGVRGVTYCVGQGLDFEGLFEPMLAYRPDEARGLAPVEISESRALFRDCHSLVRATTADGATAPKAVLQASRRELRRVTGKGGWLRLAVYGLRGDQAKIKLTRGERLAVPQALVESEEQLAALFELTQLMEEVADHLRMAVRTAAQDALAPGTRDPDKDDVSRIAKHLGAEPTFWAAVQVPFQNALQHLAAGDQSAKVRFASVVRKAAEVALHEAISALGSSARQLQGGAKAEARLNANLAGLMAQVAQVGGGT